MIIPFVPKIFIWYYSIFIIIQIISYEINNYINPINLHTSDKIYIEIKLSYILIISKKQMIKVYLIIPVYSFLSFKEILACENSFLSLP